MSLTPNRVKLIVQEANVKSAEIAWSVVDHTIKVSHAGKTDAENVVAGDDFAVLGFIMSTKLSHGSSTVNQHTQRFCPVRVHDIGL